MKLALIQIVGTTHSLMYRAKSANLVETIIKTSDIKPHRRSSQLVGDEN